MGVGKSVRRNKRDGCSGKGIKERECRLSLEIDGPEAWKAIKEETKRLVIDGLCVTAVAQNSRQILSIRFLRLSAVNKVVNHIIFRGL